MIEAKVVYKVWKHFLSFPGARANSRRERKLAWKFYLNYKMGGDLAQRHYLPVSCDRQWMAFKTKGILFIM